MTSAQEAGKIRFYRRKPNGSMEFLYGNSVAALGPSGSADGVIQATPEKWLVMGAITAPDKVLQVNDQLVVTFEPNAADTTDASDCEFSIPIVYGDGSQDTIGSPDDSVEWDVQQLGDEALVANVERIICAKTVRRKFALGGGRVFMSIEDDTA